jgi:hypothetical protein
VPTPVFSFPFFRRYPFLFGLTIALTYSVFCILQEIILGNAVQHSPDAFSDREVRQDKIHRHDHFDRCRHAPSHEVLFSLCLLSFRTFSGTAL